MDCRMGVYDWERETPQTIWVDLELAIDAASAAMRDDVQDTIDYGRLVTLIKQHGHSKPFNLLETMAEELAALVLREFPSDEVTIRVKKRSLPGVGSAVVEVTRTQGVT